MYIEDTPARGRERGEASPHSKALEEPPACPVAYLNSGALAGQSEARLEAGAEVLPPLGCPPLSSPDYDTVQTVGMTLATIMFLLGILIIISKCNSPGLQTPLKQGCLGSPQAPIAPLLAFDQTLKPCLLVLSLSLLTGKKVKCRKEDSRSERSGSSGETGERGVGAVWGPGTLP